jgi:FkbM family methyltransferase
MSSLRLRISKLLTITLATRRLFRNWFFATLSYALRRRNIKVKCSDGVSVIMPRHLFATLVLAYHDGVIKGYLGRENMVVSRNGLKVHLSHENVIGILRYFPVGDCYVCVRFLNKGEIVEMPDGVKFHIKYIDPSILAEIWGSGSHFVGFDLSDWLIVDIGAFVGDTALYYAKLGATVIAVEPVPNNYKALLENLELNPGLKNRIIPINLALSKLTGHVEINFRGINGGASIYTNFSLKAMVKSVNLNGLLNEVSKLGLALDKFKVKFLKMDCKGCEYDIIFDEQSLVKIFEIVKIEYSGHLRNENVDKVVKIMEDLGYICRVYAHSPAAFGVGLDKHGTISCIRRDLSRMPYTL